MKYVLPVFIIAVLIAGYVKKVGVYDSFVEGSRLGVPTELCELVVIRPLSGNGSIAILENIYKTYGADSYIARCGSVIVGASETVFYIATVYFSTTKVRKLRYAIPISLFSCYLGAVFACLLCRFI